MNLNDLKIFYTVITQGSFTAAAAYLNTSKSVISKHMNTLENELNCRLLIRSTRSLQLTEAGDKLYNHCARIMAEVDAGVDAIQQQQQYPQGTLKISAPPALGNYLLASVLPSFQQHYPDIIIDLQLESRIVNIIEEKYDLALRQAILPDSNLIVKTLFDNKDILCATPYYLQRHSPPSSPHELAQYPTLTYQALHDSYWSFQRKGHITKVPIKPVFNSNQLSILKQMALAHCGIALLPQFMIQRELEQGELIQCLPNYVANIKPVYLLYPSKQHMPAKTRVMIDFLSNYCHQ